MISRVRMRRLSDVSQRQQLAAKTGGDPNPPFRSRGDGRGRDRRGGRRGGARGGGSKLIRASKRVQLTNEPTPSLVPTSAATPRNPLPVSSLLFRRPSYPTGPLTGTTTPDCLEISVVITRLDRLDPTSG